MYGSTGSTTVTVVPPPLSLCKQNRESDTKRQSERDGRDKKGKGEITKHKDAAEIIQDINYTFSLPFYRYCNYQTHANAKGLKE